MIMARYNCLQLIMQNKISSHAVYSCWNYDKGNVSYGLFLIEGDNYFELVIIWMNSIHPIPIYNDTMYPLKRDQVFLLYQYV